MFRLIQSQLVTVESGDLTATQQFLLCGIMVFLIKFNQECSNPVYGRLFTKRNVNKANKKEGKHLTYLNQNELSLIL